MVDYNLKSTLTVRALIERLQAFPPELSVYALWDTIPAFPLHRVELYKGRVVIDCDSPEGWDALITEDP